jgi:hypothetical protein
LRTEIAPFATGIEKPAEAQALKAGCVALVDDRKKDLIPAGAEDVPEQAFEKHAPGAVLAQTQIPAAAFGYPGSLAFAPMPEGCAKGATSSTSADNLAFLEHKPDFERRVFDAVGAMHGITLDVLGELFADRPWRGIRWIGCAHDLAVLGDGILALEDLQNDRAGSHELHKIGEEGPLFVNSIECGGVRFVPMHPFLRNDAQAGVFEFRDDLAGYVPGCGIGFDNGKGALDGHVFAFS